METKMVKSKVPNESKMHTCSPRVTELTNHLITGYAECVIKVSNSDNESLSNTHKNNANNCPDDEMTC